MVYNHQGDSLGREETGDGDLDLPVSASDG